MSTPRHATTQFSMQVSVKAQGRRTGPNRLQTPIEVPIQAPRRPATDESDIASKSNIASKSDIAPESAVPPSTEPGWLTADRIARSLHPRIHEIWTDVLTRYTDGDEAMARRVYDVLSGFHLLGELWRNTDIDELHIHGTDVTVCGRDGMRPVPGFPDLATAQRAVEAFKGARAYMGAVVSHVGTAVIVSRDRGAGPDASWLLASGIVTDDQLSQVKLAMRHLRAVTVTGPAARIVVRALASLIPAGSRIYLGSYATLPRGCVTAATPLEADFVVGVRPGQVAEEMADEGQVAALIANPERPIRAALRLAVSGPSAAPDKVSQLP
ncbi:hypothetical protein LUW76_34560 [Actinomadura madurae]|uniref:hypothetical protein n=1 Tax=Actinomadura madurae TaxID=1993 RepID=UPI0020265E7E|nr:hypothetical protein [Actinomadura madurae]URM99044.1 hypothetical protein LUW76_34560 [Actinomadura madurae]